MPELAAVIIALIFAITILIFTGTVLILLYAFAQIWMSNSNDMLKKTLVLALLFVLGAFLGISAIASVPWLQQEVTIPSTLSESRLEEQLRASLLTELWKDEDPFVNLRAFLLTAPDDTSSPIADSADSPLMNANLGTEQQIAFADAQNSLRWAEGLRGVSIARYEVHQQDVQNRLEQLLKHTIDHYELYIGIQMNPQKRLTYFRDVSQWFHQKHRLLNAHLAHALEDIVELDICWKDWAVNMQHTLEYPGDPNVCLPENTWTALKIPDLFVGTPFPEAPKPELGLASFSVVANWLLETGSLTLVLITGMIGFGVMGSAISCTVGERLGEKKKENDNQDDEKDDRPWSVVVVKYFLAGISAAIVIFLTVEGGLAIFSVGELEPNAYALFFACFVGAVFSQVVWRRARNWIDPDRQENGKAGDNKENGKGGDGKGNTTDAQRTTGGAGPSIF